jgi:hypothetical protein
MVLNYFFPREVRDKNKESSIYTQNYCFLHDIYKQHSHLSKISLYNQPKPYFFQKIIMKSFLDRFLTNVTPNKIPELWTFIWSFCTWQNVVTVQRRVWRYQRGNQNPYIEEEQTTQWPKEKGHLELTRGGKACKNNT